MKVVKSYEMKEIDRYTIEEIGIPGIVLMENAAMSVVSETIQILKGSRHVVICCGIGNNGGDGFAIGRILSCNNIKATIIIIGDSSKIKGDAKINYDIARKLDIDIYEYKTEKQRSEIKKLINDCDVIYDAIFGTGLCREITGQYLEVINMMNSTNAYKVAVDIPSGVNADNGQILGTSVCADKTVTFCLPKVGLLLYPGANYVGDLVVGDIGIPNISVDRINSGTSIMDDNLAKYFMPNRVKMSHKGTYGKVLIIAGTRNMIGAAVMTSLAAYRTGAGLVKSFIEESVSNVITTKVPEAVIDTYNRDNDKLSREDKGKLLEMLKWADTIAIGPGLGNDNITREMLEIVISNFGKTVVIDADGINALSKDVDILNKRNCEVIITPHLGEMSRLTNYDIDEITNNTIKVAQEFSKEYKITCILKSARTIISSPNGMININIYGNSGMATAGSGDVLTGIVVSLLGQGINVSDAAILGVYIHSKAGDRAKDDKGEYGLIANDLIGNIPYVMKSSLSE
ncbi:NAD(P)H-hydrate dehydratase [Vallitalea sediminicola]